MKITNLVTLSRFVISMKYMHRKHEEEKNEFIKQQ